MNSIVRWTARISSIVCVIVIGLFIFGGNENNEFNNINEMIGFSLFPVGMLVGTLLGWKWEIIGGVISVVSLAAFYAPTENPNH